VGRASLPAARARSQDSATLRPQRRRLAPPVVDEDVTVQPRGLDKYKRTIADVFLPDRPNVNHALVRDGWCWWYPKYAPENVILAELQRRARRSGLGLWADPAPIPPWEWRKRSR
jgi:endonuclease YncB( thermonuclease family)